MGPPGPQAAKGDPGPPGPTNVFGLTVALAGDGRGAVISSDEGINCGADCTEVYPAGTSITLTAVPDRQFVFAGWSGDCSGTDPRCTVVLETTRMVTAHFDIAPPTGIVGVYNITPSFSYSCLDGNLSFNVSAFQFLGAAPFFLRGIPTLTLISPGLFLQGPPPGAGADFTAQAVIPGDATETYTLTGTFRADRRTWDGVFTFTCSGPLCNGGGIFGTPCTNQSFPITGTRL